MPHSRYSSEEIARRGEQLYENKIRKQVELEENMGKVISIDIETGDYEIDDDPLSAGRRLQAKHAGAALYGKRIGYNAVYSLGGSRKYRCTSPQLVFREQGIDFDKVIVELQL